MSDLIAAGKSAATAPEPSVQPRRQQLRALFTQMLGALGRKDFDAFETYVHEDAVFTWPYPPVDDFDGEITGRGAFRKFCEFGMADCDPFNYTIQAIYDQADPDLLIAEYTSHSFFYPKNVPYSNRYMSVFKFEGDKIVYWKEYINPLIVKRIYGEDFKNTDGLA